MSLQLLTVSTAIHTHDLTDKQKSLAKEYAFAKMQLEKAKNSASSNFENITTKAINFKDDFYQKAQDTVHSIHDQVNNLIGDAQETKRAFDKEVEFQLQQLQSDTE
tara:strand:+ start:1486 stop:1803 length:318 start_codon:yes stop_codon:yes gene_type:complete